MPTAEQQLAAVRKVLPQQFQTRFDKLWKKQRRELLKIVGDPPEPKRVTATQWKKWEKEQAAALLMLMLGYMLSQTNAAIEEIETINQPEMIPGDNPRTQSPTSTAMRNLPSAIRRRVLRIMRDRARFASQSITRTTRSRLAGGMHPDEILSDSRSRTIATTEMTAARSASVIGMYLELRRIGIECELVWRLRPCQHCEVCPLLDGTPYDYWSQFFTNGPPVHPNCCCQLELLFGNRRQLLRKRRMKTGPPVRNVWKAIQRAGFKTR